MGTRTEELREARRACEGAEAVLITAGAGMGVDSGLPDFRGPEGFWRAYPAYKRLGMRFEEMANPARFADDPAVGWGFYGHRRRLYRETEPHEGFARLRDWGSALPGRAFIFTSNVDGHFQRAGFAEERILECHGSIHQEQCWRDCEGVIWPAEVEELDLDEGTMRAREPFPACPRCGGLARPNILMFGDFGWNPRRTLEQEHRYEVWRREIRGSRVVVLEFGAGTALPTVRMESERRAARLLARLIRVNPREPEAPPGQIGLAMGARDAIRELVPEG